MDTGDEEVADTTAVRRDRSTAVADAVGIPDDLRKIWTYVIPAASVIGLLVYGMLRQLYATFYGSLGASPEEVGLGYSETLSLSGIAVLWIVVMPAGLAALVPSLRPGRPHYGVRILTSLLLLALGAVLLYWATWSAAGRAYDGRAVTSVNVGPLQVLGLRAEPATFWWRAGREAADPDLAPGTCVLYLGQANGTTVLYDPGPGIIRTIRVQTSDVLIDVARADRQPGQQQHGDVRCQDHRVVIR
jgi:hypothetical protein